jgi:hypothetical protein
VDGKGRDCAADRHWRQPPFAPLATHALMSRPATTPGAAMNLQRRNACGGAAAGPPPAHRKGSRWLRASDKRPWNARLRHHVAAGLFTLHLTWLGGLSGCCHPIRRKVRVTSPIRSGNQQLHLRTNHCR